MSDPQRKRVYRWENLLPGDRRKLTKQECQKLVNRIWQDYYPGQNPPAVATISKGRMAYGTRRLILLPPWARTTMWVCHEVAHSLVPFDAHGPIFAAVLLDLYATYAGVDQRIARFTAQQAKIRLAQVHLRPCQQRTSEVHQLMAAVILKIHDLPLQRTATKDKLTAS